MRSIPEYDPRVTDQNSVGAVVIFLAVEGMGSSRKKLARPLAPGVGIACATSCRLPALRGAESQGIIQCSYDASKGAGRVVEAEHGADPLLGRGVHMFNIDARIIFGRRAGADNSGNFRQL